MLQRRITNGEDGWSDFKRGRKNDERKYNNAHWDCGGWERELKRGSLFPSREVAGEEMETKLCIRCVLTKKVAEVKRRVVKAVGEYPRAVSFHFVHVERRDGWGL